MKKLIILIAVLIVFALGGFAYYSHTQDINNHTVTIGPCEEYKEVGQ